MKRKQVWLLLSVVLCTFAFSCRKQVAAHYDINFLPEGDSVYLNAQENLYVNPLLSRKMLKEALDTRQVKDSIDWYILYSLYIKTYLVTSEFDSIIPLCRKTEQFCARQEQLTPYHYYLLTDVNNNIGNRYAIISQNDSALKYFKQMLFYGEKTHNRKVKKSAYTNLADIYVRSGHYDLGAWNYCQALYIADSLGLPEFEVNDIYTGLGQTYMELRDFELSHYYYDLAYKLFNQMDLNRKFVYLTNYGNVYYFEKDYSHALELFKKAYQLVSSSPEYAYAQNLCRLNMGECYLLLGELDSARVNLNECYSYFKEIGNTSGLYHAETQLFELALQSGNLGMAARQLHSITDNLYAEPTLVGIRKRYLQHYYEETGNYRKAYQYLKENTAMDDSIRNDQVRMRVKETELRYQQDTTLMKQRLFIQEQQSSMKSLELSVYIWVLVCVLLFISVLFVYFYQKKQRALLMAETRNKIITLRMENIRNRVSPHFIFNALNRVMSHYKESDSNYKELHNLIKIMRLNLRLTEKLSITLAEEIDFVRTYLALEQERFDDSLHVSILIDEGIDPEKVELPSMMIQIPVENALKHGLRQKAGEKLLAISVVRQSDSIVIRIEDNGVGFRVQAGNQDLQSTGTGLRVLNQTIQLLNARNAEAITLRVEKSPQGTDEYPGCLVEVTLPDHYSYFLPEK